MGRFERHRLGARLTPIREDHGGPAQTDQQTIRAGHVRRGEGGVFWIFTGHPSKVHVHGILRKHRDQSQQRQRKRLRNIQLGQLRRPRKHEGSAKDRQSGAQRLPFR